ncbi:MULTISPECIES: AsmA family protein [unclassified Ectothiorhodospira]|uniref:AsmA family protein n=1 Tax=unclassified Ectothiorhodospira TaxID=2684909 RepID=UPI001EE956D0|nr:MULTISPECIES: AsmA family protein [unclassified Ectothiorhodospira]MCG5515308.1 AsmA family protein [Ectothiorhodospira sp. 9100]MCG5519411.1 AsmA family protein [Ectothiorhodospira sp. 9905]
MKWIKRGLLALFGLLVLFVVLVGFLLVTVDPNDYKDRISEVVEEQTGRTLVISGDIGLSVFPRLGLELGEATLSNAEGFEEAHFARVGEVDVAVALLPLLRRELQVQQVRLEGLELNLARDADGRANWDDLVDAEAIAEQPEGEASPVTRSGDDSAVPEFLRGLDVAGIQVRDARLNWRDDQSGTRMSVDPFNLELGRLRLAEETTLKLSMRTRMDDLETGVELQGLLLLDVSNQRYALRRMVAQLDATGDALPAPIEARVEADLIADLRNDLAKVERLTVNAFDTQFTGLVEVAELSTEPRIHGELRSGRFSPRRMMETLAIEPPETANPDVLTNAAMDLALTLQGNVLDLTQLIVTLDDSTLTGQATVKNLASPDVSMAMQLDRINLDHYLPPTADPDGNGGGSDDTQARDGWPDEPLELPVDSLRELKVTGDLSVGNLTVAGLSLQDVNLELRARDGRLDVESIRAALYEGQLDGSLGLDVRQDTPRIQARQALEGIRFGGLLEDLTGKAMVTGGANVSFDITSRGNSVKALINGLNGNGQMRVADGAVKGINVAQIIRDAEARVRGRSPEETDEPRQTDFTEITGSFNINDGVVKNDDLQAASPLLRIRGRGEADLNRERLDYRLDTSLVGTLEGQGGRDLSDLRNVNLPITIRGSFSEPSFGLDLRSVFESRVREEAEERVREQVDPVIEEQRERLREEGGRLQEELGDRLLDRLR